MKVQIIENDTAPVVVLTPETPEEHAKVWCKPIMVTTKPYRPLSSDKPQIDPDVVPTYYEATVSDLVRSYRAERQKLSLCNPPPDTEPQMLGCLDVDWADYQADVALLRTIAVELNRHEFILGEMQKDDPDAPVIAPEDRDNNTPEKYRKGRVKVAGEPGPLKLNCLGCAHSAAGCATPLGERPCVFCVRNPFREAEPPVREWYDGEPAVKIPMDCYHSEDMREQIAQWQEKEQAKTEEVEGFALGRDLQKMLRAYAEGEGLAKMKIEVEERLTHLLRMAIPMEGHVAEAMVALQGFALVRHMEKRVGDLVRKRILELIARQAGV